MGLERFIQLIKQGEPVSPGTDNRPLRQLSQNIEYLWELIQAAELGSTVYARDVTVEADAQVGMAVYLDASSQTFRRALAAMEVDPATGVVSTSPTAQVWGVVSQKHQATKADLLLFGYASLDLSAAIVADEVAAGGYYLSGIEAGKLVQQRPSVSVPVLRSDGNDKVFVNPSFIDFLDSHRHYKFSLTAAPAGQTSPPGLGERHVITSPDDSLSGWLPANHAVFAGRAPARAVFGYNLRADAALWAAWPPLPVQHSYLEWDRADDLARGLRGVPLGEDGLCVINRDGVWWMSDCYGDVPWPTSLDTSVAESESASVSESAPPECPRDMTFQLCLWFTRVNFATENVVVTSLRSLDNRIKIYCAGTETESFAGDLEIDLDLDLTLGVENKRGHLAVKELNDGKLDRGPVVSGIYSLTENVLLTSSVATTKLDEDDEESADVYHGPVGVSLVENANRELRCQLVRLNGATEEHYPALYIGLGNAFAASFVAQFEVPTDAPDPSQFQYRIRLIGRAAGTLPELTVRYSRVTRPPDGLTTPVAVTDTYTAMTIDTEGVLSAANQAVEALSDPIEVSPGDLVFVEVSRDPEVDDYSNEVGVLQQVGVLSVS